MLRKMFVSQNLPAEESDKILRELKLGYINLKEKYFDLAKQNFQLVLEFDPNCSEGFWGLALANDNVANESELYSDPAKHKNFINTCECQNALKFAQEDQKNIYNDLLTKVYQINEGNNY